MALLENAVKTNIAQGRAGGHGGAVATGTLLGSVFGEMHGSPVAVHGVVAAGPPADRYALVVERGRTPGRRMPPAEALLVWVRQKLHPASDKIARSLAFVIARSVGRKGFPGVHMFENAFRAHQANVRRLIRRRAVEECRRQIGRSPLSRG